MPDQKDASRYMDNQRPDRAGASSGASDGSDLLSAELLAAVLIRNHIIDCAAWADPDGYDDGVTRLYLTTAAAELRDRCCPNDGLCVGKIMPANTMILRQHVGEATLGKLKYAMSSGVNGQPVLKSEQTGKWFTISWQEILELAVKAGIDA